MGFLKVILICTYIAIIPRSTTVQPDYSGYKEILKNTVTASGEVDYSSIIRNYKSQLDQFLNQLASVKSDELDNDQRLAFWINTYNAFTIKLITEHWPVKSIKDIADGKPWDKVEISLNGKEYSLNQIENEIIRTQFNDARIHFAINCAAVSCPPLLNEPYYGNKLNEQLDERTRKFINNIKYNQLSQVSLNLSQVFSWYQHDFNGVISFIKKYSEKNINKNASIRFNVYDWAIND